MIEAETSRIEMRAQSLNAQINVDLIGWFDNEFERETHVATCMKAEDLP